MPIVCSNLDISLRLFGQCRREVASPQIYRTRLLNLVVSFESSSHVTSNCLAFLEENKETGIVLLWSKYFFTKFSAEVTQFMEMWQNDGAFTLHRNWSLNYNAWHQFRAHKWPPDNGNKCYESFWTCFGPNLLLFSSLTPGFFILFRKMLITFAILDQSSTFRCHSCR